ncbi:MAG: methyltransferase domain-containing protein [Planctomycetota bacterium]
MNDLIPRFTWGEGGAAYFHGVLVDRRYVDIGGHVYEIAALKDAADLLQLWDYGQRFVEKDVAPYGMELWPGAVILATHLSEAEPGRGRSAVDLGCGLGLLAIVATRLGWDVTATDNDDDALRFSRYNAGLNGIQVARFETLDWHRPPEKRRFDRVLGGDVLYQVSDHEPILRCVESLLADNGEALFADPHRGAADRFPTLAENAGFAVEVLSGVAQMTPDRRIDGRIFRLTRPG